MNYVGLVKSGEFYQFLRPDRSLTNGYTRHYFLDRFNNRDLKIVLASEVNSYIAPAEFFFEEED